LANEQTKPANKHEISNGRLHGCLQSEAPKYLTVCTPVSNTDSRRHLRSASRHHLSVLRPWLTTSGRRAFSVAGLTVWNSLPDSPRDPTISSSSFRQLLKTNFFNCYSAQSAQQRCYNDSLPILTAIFPGEPA